MFFKLLKKKKSEFDLLFILNSVSKTYHNYFPILYDNSSIKGTSFCHMESVLHFFLNLTCSLNYLGCTFEVYFGGRGTGFLYTMGWSQAGEEV